MMKYLAIALLASTRLAHAQPKPPTEVADLVKATAGTYACTGKTVMPDGKTYDTAATITTRADLDGFWIHDQLSGSVGGLGKFSVEVFTTFDPTDKLWHRMMFDWLGGYLVGAAKSRLDFEMTGSGPFGAYRFRDRTDASNPKLIKKSGERSRDGKVWTKDYDLACTRS